MHSECMSTVHTVEPDGPTDVERLRLLCDKVVAGDAVVHVEVEVKLDILRNDRYKATLRVKVDVEETGQGYGGLENLEGFDLVVVLSVAMLGGNTDDVPFPSGLVIIGYIHSDLGEIAHADVVVV